VKVVGMLVWVCLIAWGDGVVLVVVGDNSCFQESRGPSVAELTNN
jgi:hypothetical protein